MFLIHRDRSTELEFFISILILTLFRWLEDRNANITDLLFEFGYSSEEFEFAQDNDKRNSELSGAERGETDDWEAIMRKAAEFEDGGHVAKFE